MSVKYERCCIGDGGVQSYRELMPYPKSCARESMRVPEGETSKSLSTAPPAEGDKPMVGGIMRRVFSPEEMGTEHSRSSVVGMAEGMY